MFMLQKRDGAARRARRRPGDELGKARLDRLAETHRIQVDAHDPLVGEHGLEYGVHVARLPERDGCKARREHRQERVVARLERLPVVVHRHQIAAPCGQHEGDELEILHVERVRRRVLFDRVAEPDGDLLGGIGRDALRRIL